MFQKAVEIALGLCYIHESGITHRNLKLSNVIRLLRLDRYGYIKITDSGLTRDTLASMLAFGQNDFPFYDAPEIIQDEP